MLEKMQTRHPDSDWQRVSGLASTVFKLCLEWIIRFVFIWSQTLGISLMQDKFLQSVIYLFVCFFRLNKCFLLSILLIGYLEP